MITDYREYRFIAIALYRLNVGRHSIASIGAVPKHDTKRCGSICLHTPPQNSADYRMYNRYEGLLQHRTYTTLSPQP